MPVWQVLKGEVGTLVIMALTAGVIAAVVLLRMLPPNVAQLQSRGRVGSLIRALKRSRRTDVRRHAALSLGMMGQSRAVAPLMSALSDRDEDVRRQALYSLAALGDASALEPLIAALTSSEETLRVAAADGLARIGAPEAIAPLIRAMEDESEAVRHAAVAALVSIGEAAVEPLIETLYSPNRNVFLLAAKALGIMCDPRATDPLIASLTRRDPTERLAAADALDSLGWRPEGGTTAALYWVARRSWERAAAVGPEAVPLLVLLLDDSDPALRLDAIETLGHIAHSSAVTPLLGRYRDPDDATREAVRRALDLLGSTVGVNAFIDALGKPEAHVRAAAAEVLGNSACPDATDPLAEALRDDDKEVRRAAATALERLHWKPEGSEAAPYYWVTRRNWARCLEIGPPAVPALIGVLPSSDLDTRIAIARVLGRIGDERVIQPLTACLEDADPELVEAVFAALERIGEPAMEVLVEALTDPREVVSVAAARALGAVGNVYALEHLIGALRHECTAAREAAVRAMGALGSLDAIGPLVSAVIDRRLDDPSAIADALAALGEPAIQPLLTAAGSYNNPMVSETIGTALAAIGHDAVAPSRAALAEAERGTVMAAAEALGRLADPHAIPALVTALENAEPTVHQVVVQALDRLGWQPTEGETAARYWAFKHDWERCAAIGAAALTPLLEALNDADAALVAGAALALGRVGDPRAVKALIDKARAPEPNVRVAVAGALGDLADPRGVMPLITAMEDDDMRVVMAATEALGKIGAPGVAPLMEALRTEDADRRDATARALAGIGAPAVGALIKALSDRTLHVALGAADALGQIGDKRAIDPLLACLAHENAHLRTAACRALGAFGDQRVVMPLAEMLKDRDYEVRYAATAALGKIRDPRAVRPLIAALKHENPDVREAAAEALGESGDAWAVEPLLAVLGDERFSVQTAAARALGALGEQATQPVVHALRTSSQWNVRYAATMALGLIGSERAVQPLIAALEDDDSRVRYSAACALDRIATEEALDATHAWRASMERVWDIVDAGTERKLLESEIGPLAGARVYRITPLKDQTLQEHDHLTISGTLTCASCEGSFDVADIDIALRRSLFADGRTYTWTCPQCDSHTGISGFITDDGKAEPGYWLAVQRDNAASTRGAASGSPRLIVQTLAHDGFEQVFARR